MRAVVFAACSALGLACSEGTTTGTGRALEGTLEVIVVEGPHGGTRYFLMPDDTVVEPVELRFESPPTSGSGARIAVDGTYEGSAFHVSAFDLPELDPERSRAVTGRRVEALAESPPERTRTIAFVMVDYGEGVNVAEGDAQRFMFSTTNPGPTLGIGPNDKSTLQFYDETSYGFFGVSGDVEGPLQWTGSAACNGSGGSQLASQLRSQITTTYGHYIWYYGSEQSACEYGWGSLGNWTSPSSNVWFNGDLFDGAITHEIGHNLGYQHASSIRCSGTPLANDPMTCTTTEYGSAVSIMGNTSNGHMMAIEKWYAGWFKGCNAVRVRASGTFNLLPIETACSGVQALQIPMPVTTRTFDTQQSSNPSPARYYYLEYRNGTGLDTGMTPSVIVVASDDIAPPNRVCARSVQMDMNPSTTNNLNGMTQGQTYEDPAGGLSFTVSSLTPALATVTVTMSAAAMPNTCMDGTTLSGSGPATCTGGAGGTGGMGGMGGTAGGGSGGRGGSSGAGAGGAPMAGSGGTPMAGSGGAPVAGNGGAPMAGAAGSGGVVTGGSGGSPGGGTAGTSGGSPSTAGGGSAGATGVAGTPGVAGSAGATTTGGSAGSGTTAPPTIDTTDTADDAGCGCRVGTSSTRRSAASLWSLAVAALLVTRRRRAPSISMRRS